MFYNQELIVFAIVSFILLTFVFDSGAILLGEVRWLSLLGVKGFKTRDEKGRLILAKVVGSDFVNQFLTGC